MEALETRMWNPVRQCTGTNRSGHRCERNAAPFQTTCVMHGARTPVSIAAAKARMLEACEPAISRLVSFIQTPPGLCPVCGRCDDTSAIVSAIRTLLDRAGLHPSMSLQVETPAPNQLEDMSAEDLENRAQHLAKLARGLRTHVIEAEAAETGDVIDLEEEPVHTEPARIPLGNPTPEPSTAETVENTGDPDDV